MVRGPSTQIPCPGGEGICWLFETGDTLQFHANAGIAFLRRRVGDVPASVTQGETAQEIVTGLIAVLVTVLTVRDVWAERGQADAGSSASATGRRECRDGQRPRPNTYPGEVLNSSCALSSISFPSNPAKICINLLKAARISLYIGREHSI